MTTGLSVAPVYHRDDTLLAAFRKPRSRNKYNAVRCKLDGFSFDSRKEMRRYAELRLLERAGLISGLEVHPTYSLTVNGQKVADYVADFRYRDKGGCLVVEDTKSVPTRTKDYRIKKKLMAAIHGIHIAEV